MEPTRTWPQNLPDHGRIMDGEAEGVGRLNRRLRPRRRFRGVLSRLLLAVMLLTALAPGSWGSDQAVGADPAIFRHEKVHPDLLKKMEAAGTDDQFTVVIKGKSRADLESIKFQSDQVIAALKQEADAGQAGIVSLLQARKAEVVNRLWLINAVVAKVDRATLQSLTSLSGVEQIHENFAVNLPPVEPGAAPDGDSALTWGLAKIGADRVWNDFGSKGQGVRVAVLDTGVDVTHPDLQGKMHSDNPGDPTYPGGWMMFDDYGNLVRTEPHDYHGHGTHVSGTVLGGAASGIQIGVAPEATLMHGNVLPGGGGSLAGIIAGMQWALDPVDADGNPAGRRADVVSMSLGAPDYWSEFIEPVRNLYFAGVVPVIAAGNEGQGSIRTPGAVFESVTIGASMEDDSIVDFSSGAVVRKDGWVNPPAEWPDEWIKPDVSAPGVNVYSSVPGGGYDSWAGTSMATPHVAGVVAMMLAANPDLTPKQVLEAVSEGAYWDDRHGQDRPNIRYGHGRVDAYESVSRVAYQNGISGKVIDAATGEALERATVLVEGTGRQTRTRSDGTFTLVLEPGTYSLKIERFGYEPYAIPDLVVKEGEFVSADAAMTPLPTGVLRGTVRYGPTQIGIPGATVKVQDLPVDVQVQTGADGSYLLRLPAGTYSLEAAAYGFSKDQADDLTVQVDGTTIHDFVLDALPRVAVIGDPDDNLIRFLGDSGYKAEPTWFDIHNRMDDYEAVVVNVPGWASEEEFKGLVDAAHQAGVGMIFTQGYGDGWGVDMLQRFYGDPASIRSAFTMDSLVLEVTEEHPELLPGRTAGDKLTLLSDCCWVIGAFEEYSGKTLGALHGAAEGHLGQALAIKENENNRHVLLGGLGSTWFQGPQQWTEEGRELFLNAVQWAAKPESGGPKYVQWDLKTSPDTVLWYQTVTASLGVKNIGDAAGTTDVTVTVNGEPLPPETVTLNPDQHQTVSFDIQREPVGSYLVQAEHLSASFRVRPPKVTVQASTLDVPASGKGKKAVPKEPAIPLAGAQVDVIKNGKVISRGALDTDGQLTFDSLASKDDYTIVIRHQNYGYNNLRHYLLTMPVHVEDDVAYTFAPKPRDVALLDASLNAKDVNHHGSLFLSGAGLGKVGFEFPTGTLVVTPGEYRIANVMAYDMPGAQWAYASQWEPLNLPTGSQSYAFGGDLTLAVSDVRGQQAPKVQIHWGMKDAYGHDINSIHKVAAGAFGLSHSRVVADVDTWPATILATALEVKEPVLTLTNPAGAIERTGTVPWKDRPKDVDLDVETVMPGDYGLLMQSDTGPYMGMLEAKASLMVPARSVSKTRLMPGDTFDVTVIFDAGPKGHLSMKEQLPDGFTIVEQSSEPKAKYDNGLWHWHPSGKNRYRPGQTIKVTYTVQVGADVPAGTYELKGTVTQDVAERPVAGPQSVRVVR